MVQQWKVDLAKKLADDIKNYGVVGIVDINKLPSKQYQEIKHKLKGKAHIKVVKKRVLLKALELAGLRDKLEEVVKESIIIGLLLSNENPFKLYKFTEKNKSLTFAKVGDIAPHDIIVPEGDTGLPPGPIIGELKGAGIKARIQGNSIVVQEDSKVASKGDVINENVANILMKLNIKPIEIGINIKCMYENGVVYSTDVLSVDEQEYLNNVMLASSQAFNLAYNADYYIPEIMEMKVAECIRHTINLLVNEDIYCKEIMDLLFSKAHGKAMGLIYSLPDDVCSQLGVEKPTTHTTSQPTTTQQNTDKKEEKKESKEDEEKKAEEAAAGLGALFG